MLSTPKKIIFVSIPLAIAGMGVFWFSNGQKQSFGSTNILSSIPADTTMTDAVTQPGENVIADTDTPAVETKTVPLEEVVPVMKDATEKNPSDGTKKTDSATTDAKTTDTKAADTLTADTKNDSGFSITDRLVSFGHESRTSREIDAVIVHSSYDALGIDPYSVSGVIEEYRQYGVSPHYLVDRKGMVYRLVKDGDVAYHAGASKMPDGRSGVNEFSIGIEVIGKDTDSPTSAQYKSLRSLVASLKSKYPIKYVLGHSDIAPGRKSDPWGFDWKEMKSGRSS